MRQRRTTTRAKERKTLVLEELDAEPIVALLEDMVTPERRRRLLDVIDKRVASVTVVMDAPHDPHNAAAVLRSCDAFGVFRIHVVQRGEPAMSPRAKSERAWLPRSTVAKGTEQWIDAVSYRSVDAAVTALRAQCYTLIGTHPAGGMTPDALGAIERPALVMGNEHDGISDELWAACEAHVRVPMRGFVESLNVSVSAAILLSHATAGRPGDVPASLRRQLYARGLILTVPRALEILEARGMR